MKRAIEALMRREDLDGRAMREAATLIVEGRAASEQVAAFLCLLHAKTETAEEVSTLVEVMLEHAIPANVPGTLLDIVGTGGDGHHTVNFSTAAAILSATCGARVCKHGNRSVSSSSGSADVLEALGVRMLKPEHVAPCVEGAGIAFMFAPNFHPAMRHVVPVRKALGVRTVFNILGPLLNPAGAKRLMLGVYTPDLLPLYGRVLYALRVEHALVVHCGGLDELAPLGEAQAVEVTPQGGVRPLTLDALALGFPPCSIADLAGGSPRENAEHIRRVFAGGEAADTAVGHTIAMNAGAALYVYGVSASIAEGTRLAYEALKAGRALKTLDALAETTQALAGEHV